MLQITNTVITKDAQVVAGNLTYAVHYSVINGKLSSVQCAVSFMDGDQFEQIGYIRKENGRLNSDFSDKIAMTEHITVFEGIVKEVEADLSAQTNT